MGHIYYLMGKSASGKDQLRKALMEDPELGLREVVLYTTRPMRLGEQNGREYFFISERQVEALEASGKIIEERCYQTVHGPWRYLTVDDGQICLEQADYLMIGTLESYGKVREYFGKDALVPLYIYVEDGIRLERALKREQQENQPKYAELCRRFLADEADFSSEKLKDAGISEYFENVDFAHCLKSIKAVIR